MMRAFGKGRYANVTSTMALVVALGGTSYAAVTLPKNSVGSAQIKRNGVASSDIRGNAVTSAKVKNGSLLATDFKAGQIPAGKQGPAGAAGAAGGTGAAGSSIFDAAIPSGKTIRGVWGGSFPATNASTVYFARVGFPIPAPVGLTNANVSFPASTANVLAADQDAACAGTVDLPTAPAGKVCVYVDQQSANVTDMSAQQVDGESTNQSKLGFAVQVTATGGANDNVTARGTWAYTAP
jgi:hypothetical protein